MNNFNQKLNRLPKDVQEFLISMKASELNLLICSENNINSNDFTKVAEIISRLYFKELEIPELELELINVFGFDEKNAKKMALKIVGIRLLIVDDWFNGKAKKYLEKQGAKIKDYEKYIEIQKQAIKEENEFFKEELADDFQEHIPNKPEEEEIKPRKYNEQKEKEDSREIFSGMLSCFLADHVNPFLEDYNSNLIQLFVDDSNFKNELENELYNNGEFLTHERFEMDSKTQSPTIGNWIQDFIKVYGSGMFNNLALSKYITESKNAKLLGTEEKKLVQKLLQLYRNLKFFPESLRDVPMEEWEIIPVKKEKETIGQTRKIWGPPKTEEEKKIDELRREEEQFSEGGLERLAIEEEIDNKKKLESLKIEANKYTAGSLERMAVEEEIRRFD
ncbi:hypothetical protein KAI65_00360 [Candidatus Parcubacteria bacterium]|nr:hypothetical protein [Candidatus Parcubacteria bacterium]